MTYVKAAEREQQIVAATVQVLHGMGVTGLTLRAVAAEAGIPLGTLHYVFPSKDQLLRAVIDAVVGDLIVVLRAKVDLDRGVEHALRQATTNFWSGLVESDIGGQIMQYELTTYSLRSDVGLARSQYASYVSAVSALLDQAAQAAGERCQLEFDEIARLSVATTDGLILQYLADPDRARATRDLDRMIDMLMSLAKPQRASSRQARSRS